MWRSSEAGLSFYPLVLWKPGRDCVTDRFPWTNSRVLEELGWLQCGVKSGQKFPGRKPPLADLLEKMLPWLHLTPREDGSGTGLDCG